MDTETEKIYVSELVQVTETTSSVAMEKLGFQRCMEKLKACNVTVDLIATDRHCGIRALMKKEYPNIDHHFDVWHLSKTLQKTLLAKSKTKSCEQPASWIQAVSNHLWWSAHTCDKDPELLLEKFSSVVYHTANIHSWDTCNKFHRCEHPPIREDDEVEPAWLKLDSPAHNALKDIVMDKRLLKDIRFLNRSCHTGSQEVFHGAMLKYCPKRQEFDFPNMLARTQLAIIDHNENSGRQQAVVRKGHKKGQKRYNVVFSKASKKWVIKPIYEAKEYSFIYDLLMNAVAMKIGHLHVLPPVKKDLPQNIARVPKPSKAELVNTLKARFGKS
ncbi:uncharacterized protein [Apostichopus japonicus]|uniref:uncharacterized protein n=1 Tax=Stichopus japonicus TaxID=307972 RepID=UPI003AB1B1ED